MSSQDNERIKFAINSAGIGIWEYLFESNTVVWDDTCKELYGLKRENEIPYDQAIKHIHPDDKSIVDEAVVRAIQGHNNGKYDLTYRTIGADDGILRWVHFKAQTSFNEKGEALRMSGIAQDVTEFMTNFNKEEAKKEAAIKELKESELFSRSVFFNSPVAKIVFIGQDMVIRLINENMQDMLGRDASVIGLPFMTACPELVPTPLLQRLRHVLLTGETYHQPEEKIELIRFGKPYTGYYNYIYKPLADTDGNNYGVMVTATEVTEQVNSRSKIEEAGSILETAVEMAELGTWQLDLKTGLLEYSERLRWWFGIDKDEVIDIARAYRPIDPAYRPAVKEAMAHATTPGTDGIYNVIYHTDPAETGKTRILKARGLAHFNDKGEADRIIGTVQDVTLQQEIQLSLEQEIQHRTEELDASNEELQAANEELATTNEELAELNETLIQSNDDLQQFAHVTSHDLKEPARKIKTFIERIVDDGESTLSTQSQQYLKKANKAADRMFDMIDGVLTYSKLNAAEQPTKRINLNEVLDSILSDLELLISQKEATVTYENLPAIEGAEILVYQLFYNLIINALKFSAKDKLPVISIVCTFVNVNTTQFVEIRIQDNGIGFDQRHAESIFNTFTRLNSKDSYEGTGLGLSLCKKIVTRHNGTISASGKLGEGALFTIQLPSVQKKGNI